MSAQPRHPDRFVHRHLGPREAHVTEMLSVIGASSLAGLVEETVPSSIRRKEPLALPPARSETEVLAEIREVGSKNRLFKSFIGMGYSDTITPPVILRNVLESPGWYTAYTPYQSEIAQGRLEALFDFQTMICDLTGFPVANASLLDEGTAAAEAMAMLHRLGGASAEGKPFFVSEHCHPQTIAIVRTRAAPLGIEVVVADERGHDFAKKKVYGALIQYPWSDGALHDPTALVERLHAEGAKVVMACDLLALTLLTPPGELGADIALGSSQRFGVPMGYGGPHAAFFATRSELVRQMPGRIIGLSRDAQGRPALRMALGTREQHIRREKATSNICTAQVLLAVTAAMYAVYHGPKGLKLIAEHVHRMATTLARGLTRLGWKPVHEGFFDTLRVELEPTRADDLMHAAEARHMNFRRIDPRSIGISVDEATTAADLESIFAAFTGGKAQEVPLDEPAKGGSAIPMELERESPFLTHPVFNSHHSETELLRYLKRLEAKDLSLTHSMIPLGSCTMKLNATAEMIPVTWPQFGRLHPFAPPSQAMGYQIVFQELAAWLKEITGFAGISLQPNAGSQGEYAGLLVIRQWHASRGQGHRDVCLIPQSAHGTNPASAAMAGYRIVGVRCDEGGNIDLADLETKAKEHQDRLAALMVTYPSTHGVFEEDIKRICHLVHENGGQVYMDGANMNAQVGLCRPGDIGADVCHLNLHKTFCIPHGGGGPGMGPIGVANHLVKLLPGHPVVPTGGEEAIGAVSAAPFGSASIVLISWAYIKMMGAEGLTRATEYAILNANYVAKRLEGHFPVLYKGKRGRVAHECILDLRRLKKAAGIEVEDVAKRLMDYGFHAPTVSFPVASTLMVEPTESEPKHELDRFCEALIAIHKEIDDVEAGRQPRENNVLVNAPHTAQVVTATEWSRPYPRELAAFPLPWVRESKFWPAVGRVDGVAGDRHLVCAWPAA
jgi:glycine dehydrogenase